MRRKAGEQTYTRPIHETTCDRCGEAIKPVRGYKVDEFTLERMVGDVFPEGSFAWYHRVNCCSDCWPFLVNGVELAGFTFWHQQAEDDEPSEPDQGWRDA